MQSSNASVMLQLEQVSMNPLSIGFHKKTCLLNHRGLARFLVDLGHILVEKKYILGKK